MDDNRSRCQEKLDFASLDSAVRHHILLLKLAGKTKIQPDVAILSTESFLSSFF